MKYKYCEDVLKILEAFASLCTRHLGRISTVAHCVDLGYPIIRPVYLVRIRSIQITGVFDLSRINNVLAIEFMGPAHTN